jgi:dihydrolipoamide dehydrogenase
MMPEPDDLLILGDGPGAVETALAAVQCGLRVRQVAPPPAPDPRAVAGGWPWPFGIGAAPGPLAVPASLEGTACLGGGGVTVLTAGGHLELRPRRIVLAPRARPVHPAWWTGDLPPPDPATFTGPDPACVMVLGGGHTGVETAAGWADGRRRVLLVEPARRVLPDWDDAVAAPVQAALAERGVTILAGWRAMGLESAGPAVVRLRHGGGVADRLEPADLVVPALGWRPDLAGLGLEHTRALGDRFGFLQVDSRLETAEPLLHALGVAIAVPLTRLGVAGQARQVAACAAGHGAAPLRYGLVPRVLNRPCQALTAGLTPADAEARGFRAVCGRAGDDAAWVRCVRDAETGALLGVQAAGPGADAMAGQVLALLTDEASATAGAALPSVLAAALRSATGENTGDDGR